MANADLEFLCLTFGSVWIFAHIADDITTDLTAFNVIAKAPDKNRLKLTECFCDVIQIYSEAKE